MKSAFTIIATLFNLAMVVLGALMAFALIFPTSRDGMSPCAVSNLDRFLTVGFTFVLFRIAFLVAGVVLLALDKYSLNVKVFIAGLVHIVVTILLMSFFYGNISSC